MKHLNQRLLAGFLSLWMLLGLMAPLPAFADDYGSEDVESIGALEGVEPDSILQVVLPTMPEDVFDFILDPYDLIKRSRASAYDGAAFGEGHFFFKNVDSENVVSYSRNSDSLKIVNQGNVPVDVVLSVEVRNSGDFVFADNPDFLDANDDPITAPAIYLGLVFSSFQKPVQADQNNASVASAEMTGWIGGNDDAYELITNQDGQYIYHLKDGFNTATFKNLSFHLTGAANDSEDWEDLAFDEALSLAVVWELDYDKSDDLTDPNAGQDKDPAATVLFGAEKVGDIAKVYLDFGYGDHAMTSIASLNYKNKSGKDTVIKASSAILSFDEDNSALNIEATSALLAGSDWKIVLQNDDKMTCTLPFNFLMTVVDPDIDPDATMKVYATRLGETAEVELYFGSGMLTRKTVVGVYYLNANGDARIMTQSDSNLTVKDDLLKVTTTNAIFNGSDWKVIFRGAAGDFEVPITLCQPLAVNPTVEVKQAAASINGIAKLSVTYGAGSLTKETIAAINYKAPDGSSQTLTAALLDMTIQDTEVSIVVDQELYNASDWELVFSNGTDTYAVPFNLCDRADVNPTATVTTMAQGMNETTVLTVDYGSGILYKGTVTGIYYKTEAGTHTTLSASDSAISVDGNTVSVTVTDALFKGSKWVLMFSNGAEEYGVGFTLYEIPDINPSATVVSMAEKSGEDTVLTLNYGSGTLEKDSVTAITYETAGISRVLSLPSEYVDVSGNDMTITTFKDIFNGSNWALVFGSDPDAYSVPFVLRTAEPTEESEISGGLSVTVTTAATAIGDPIELSVNMGGMTSIDGLTYTTSAGKEYTIVPGPNLTVSDDNSTVSLDTFKLLYNAADTRLNFSNDNGVTASAYFDLKTEGRMRQGYVYVTQKPASMSDSAVLTIDMGQMTNITGVTYIAASGNSYTLSASNFSVSDDMKTVTIPMFKTIYNGSGWKLNFSDDSGNTFSSRFELK